MGVEHWFPRHTLPEWENRSNELVWRGGCSGISEGESLRIRFVKEIYKYNPDTQVRIGRWWSENKGIPEELFGEHIHHTSMTSQKIYFIVDGNVIASNHMWGFATGAVPFLISNAYCWFSEYLIPFVNYIPIAYDLSDLVEKIEWVKNNDTLAKEIAQGALDLTRNVFSAEFQRQYLRKEISKYIVPKET
jgi:glycosyltransferase involved in cell wall biosynthesis